MASTSLATEDTQTHRIRSIASGSKEDKHGCQNCGTSREPCEENPSTRGPYVTTDEGGDGGSFSPTKLIQKKGKGPINKRMETPLILQDWWPIRLRDVL